MVTRDPNYGTFETADKKVGGIDIQDSGDRDYFGFG